jgi:hypothetical protein
MVAICSAGAVTVGDAAVADAGDDGDEADAAGDGTTGGSAEAIVGGTGDSLPDLTAMTITARRSTPRPTTAQTRELFERSGGSSGSDGSEGSSAIGARAGAATS